MIEYKREAVPVEVIAKFNEQGTLVPLKLIYSDDVYLIDKIYRRETNAPIGFYSMQEYTCLIRGQRKKLYYDKTKSIWYIILKLKVETGRFATDVLDGC